MPAAPPARATYPGLAYAAMVQVLLLLAAIPSLTVPVWWGAVVKERAYDIVNFGTMNTINSAAGFVVGTLLAVTLRRLDRRRVMVGCALLMMVMEVLTAFATSLPQFFAVRAVNFAATGVISILGIVYLGYTASPTKSYAWYTTLQAAVQALALYAIPLLSKGLGFTGLQVVLAVVGVLIALLSTRLPRTAPVAVLAPDAEVMKAPPILWVAAIPAVLAGIAFNFYTGDFFAYSERFGNARGIDAETIGLILALTTAAGIPASLFVSWLGDRMGVSLPVFIGAIAGALAAALLLMPQFGLAGYTVAMVVFSLVWSFVFPYLLSLSMRIDPLGRLAVAMQPLRSAAGVALAALTTAATAYWGLPSVAWLAGGGVLLCPLAVWLALRLHHRHRATLNAEPLR